METTTHTSSVNEGIDTLKIQERENIELVEKFYLFIDQKRYGEIDTLFTEQHEIYYQSSKQPAAVTEMLPFVKMFYTAFPDCSHNLLHKIAKGNMVSIQMTYTGTHRNKFMEIEATNKKIDYAGIGMFEINDGKINKAWIVEDEMTMMKQIGAIA